MRKLGKSLEPSISLTRAKNCNNSCYISCNGLNCYSCWKYGSNLADSEYAHDDHNMSYSRGENMQEYR